MMPLFLLLNWRWLIPTAAVAVLGLWLGVTKIELASARKTIAETAFKIEAQKTEAAALLAKLNKAAADKDAVSAQFAIDKETDHVKAVQAIDDSRTAFERELARRVRTLPRRGDGGGCQLSPSPAPAAVSPGAATGSDGGYGQPDLESGSRLREVTQKLQADVKLCWAWAKGAGR